MLHFEVHGDLSRDHVGVGVGVGARCHQRPPHSLSDRGGPGDTETKVSSLDSTHLSLPTPALWKCSRTRSKAKVTFISIESVNVP